MNVIQKISAGITYLDGAMGTMLHQRGLKTGELPETWNLTHPDAVTGIHLEYLDAGSDIILANTFGANSLKYGAAHGKPDVTEVVAAGIANARSAVRKSGREAFVALDIGPSGKMLEPLGDYGFEEAVAMFAETVRAGVGAGADLIFIETMNDSRETKAAVLAAKENSCLPVFVTNAYDGSGKLMTGADPGAMAALLEGLRVDAYGMNCSFGPDKMLEMAPALYELSSMPLIFKPNAGMPVSRDGKTFYDVGAEEFADIMARIVSSGARIVGGCCGTSPEYIRRLAESTAAIDPLPVIKRDITCVSSYTHAVYFGKKPVLIGERINPTGKKRFKEALRAHDINYILEEGIRQEDAGADILDVNVGLPGIDEESMLKESVGRLQGVTALPLQIDTSDPAAMERALRVYNGKPMINSVNGKREVMDAVFPMAAKYGGLIVCLTLDENGIPDSADGRVEIARRIVDEAAKYGIDKKDLIIDPLAMAVSADSGAALTALEAVKRIGEELGCKTSLGVSNVSFGLPRRDIINGAFFAMALTNGLSAAILNPFSGEMIKTYRAFCALSGNDRDCADYIGYASGLSDDGTAAYAPVKATAEKETDGDLKTVIARGLKDRAAELTQELVSAKDPLDIINEYIVPALNEVGDGFEKKTLYLPQLLAAADAATAAFGVLKKVMALSGGRTDSFGTVIVATVKGDIHDIGKNIIRVLLENYGFTVIDLGRDVSPEKVLEAAKEHNARLVGLSALMTTTVPAMRETIELLHSRLPGCSVMVGGAVLTQDYADMIGADHYGRDAMASVRIAQSVFGCKA